jgi:hypothetical protein
MKPLLLNEMPGNPIGVAVAGRSWVAMNDRPVVSDPREARSVETPWAVRPQVGV